MKFINPLLDKLAGTHKYVLVFDCEFWRILGSKGYIPVQNRPNEFFMPREFGGFQFFKDDDGQWELVPPFFKTTSKPNGEVSFVSAGFSAVTEPTREVLNKIQGSLQSENPDQVFPSMLPEEKRPLVDEAIQAYLNDPNIKNNRGGQGWLMKLMAAMKGSLVVVKGTADIDAIRNACTHYNLPYHAPKELYDIAVWNPESRRKCGSAKLEATYTCVKDKFDEPTKELEKILPLGRAHDPAADAAMTLLVALYILSEEPQ